MKAVVVDIKERNAVVLTKNGEFIKIKNNGQLRVGYEVDVPARVGSTFGPFIKAASVAAVFLVALGLSYGVYSYNVPYSYVNVDINPSIELTTNVFDRVLDIDGLNEDGEKLLSAVDLRNKKLKEAIGDIVENAIDAGYLKEDETNAIMLTVTGKDDQKVEQIQKDVKRAAAEELKTEKVESEVVVEKTTLEKHDSAREQGISPGKLLLAEKLVEVKPELKAEELKDVSVKEIMKAINESRKGRQTSEKKDEEKKQEQDNGINRDITDTDKDKDKEEKPNRETGNGKEQKEKDNKTAGSRVKGAGWRKSDDTRPTGIKEDESDESKEGRNIEEKTASDTEDKKGNGKNDEKTDKKTRHKVNEEYTYGDWLKEQVDTLMEDVGIKEKEKNSKGKGKSR